MYIKIVSKDEDWFMVLECRKYRITKCADATFLSTDEEARERVINGRTIYIMNNRGETIDTHEIE